MEAMHTAADVNTSDLEQFLRQAVREAEERLEGFDSEIAELDAKRSELLSYRTRLIALIKASRALLADVNSTDDDSLDRIAEGGVDVSKPRVPPLPQPAGMTRGVAEDSSVYRVGLILRDAQNPMSREEIIAEYKRRGWVDAKWKDPESSLTQAMRRAAEYGWATREAGTWTFTTTQPPVTTDAESGIGDDEQSEGSD